ncbi:MAG: hypothetical protein M1587_04725 [Thaumarchaeota archaeon]|nr:hypothetical protein [Nitrososphaerota archaeon]
MPETLSASVIGVDSKFVSSFEEREVPIVISALIRNMAQLGKKKMQTSGHGSG